MGRRKGKSLLKLGLKRPTPKIYVNTGFGTGHYMFRKIFTDNDGNCFRLCESKDGLETWRVPVKTLSLNDMGLHRDEKTGVIKKKVI
jgi:hypothetical protein